MGAVRPSAKTKSPISYTSGGLLYKGHPLGATGVAQRSELVWQLRGPADKRQGHSLRESDSKVQATIKFEDGAGHERGSSRQQVKCGGACILDAIAEASDSMLAQVDCSNLWVLRVERP